MKKVTFVQDDVLVNGVKVAELSGRGEVYIRMINSKNELEVVARFKYRSPKAGAKHWLKFILARMTSVEIVERCNNREASNRTSPLGLAQEFGYKSLNELHCEKIKAEQEQEHLRNAIFYANIASTCH